LCFIYDIPLYILRSKSGNGYHTYIFFSSPVEAYKARLLGNALLEEAAVEIGSSSFDRFFPAQDVVAQGSFGNLIALPFQGEASESGNTVFLNPGTQFEEPFSDQVGVLSNIEKFTPTRLDEFISNWRLNQSPTAETQRENREPGWVERALRGVTEGSRNNTAASLTGYFINKGLGDNVISAILANWNQRNRPPMGQNELLRVVSSVRNTHERNHSEIALEFPDIMSGLAGDFAQLYSEHLEPPKHFFYMTYLTCLGSLLSNKISLDSEVSPQPRIFLVLLGQSADERKSTVLKKTIDHFITAFETFDRGWRNSIFEVCWGMLIPG